VSTSDAFVCVTDRVLLDLHVLRVDRIEGDREDNVHEEEAESELHSETEPERQVHRRHNQKLVIDRGFQSE
jgi:hypothetical protein